MIHFIRTNLMIAARQGEAIALARRIAARAAQVTGHDVQVAIPFGGEALRIAYIVQPAENLGVLESALMKLGQDAGYRELLAAGEGLFMPGALRDEIWRVI